MDKASVLGDAIEYVKSLKERVKTLEEQTQSVRFEIAAADGGEMSSSDENISCLSEQFPEIKVRFIGDEVLIRIHCEKKSGVVEKALAEIGKLHLSVNNSTAVIANSMLHITVIAQVDVGVYGGQETNAYWRLKKHAQLLSWKAKKLDCNRVKLNGVDWSMCNSFKLDCNM